MDKFNLITKLLPFTAICLKEPVTGVCKANHNRWYYNHKEGSCRPFVYGGCGGNGNNFKTADECNNFCSAQGHF